MDCIGIFEIQYVLAIQFSDAEISNYINKLLNLYASLSLESWFEILFDTYLIPIVIARTVSEFKQPIQHKPILTSKAYIIN